ncbi:Asp-tRNA(Asn)/Glu-tRNA(Gln) amidotransferase GatCAB subunit A [bacterium]|nr:MAG: Asp-tRNA(Asn)/Glu-tRNA(Gln) amidotransferase GatCAB subunit A [bacterium]
MEYYEIPMHTLVELIKAGDIDSASLRNKFLKRISQNNPSLNAFISVNENPGSENISVDSKLAGIPIAVKDNIAVKDMRLTCGSLMLENYISPYDATVISRLKRAGAVILGKTNMDEFAMGSSNEYSYFGNVVNPVDSERVPGGSSGGSASAVAAGLAPAALGSDTGGSVRQPASFCGVVGFKPSYGRLSRWGLVAFASSLDQIGFITKDVQDAIILYEICAGPDEHDNTMINESPPPIDYSFWDGKIPKIAVLSQSFSPAVDEKIKQRLRQVLDYLDAEVVEVTIPELDYAVPVYYIIAPAEASANLARYDGVRYGFRVEEVQDIMDMYFRTRSQGFGKEVKRRIMIGTFVLSAGYQEKYFGKAQKARRLFYNKLMEVFSEYDFVACPTTSTDAFKFGEKLDDPVEMYITDIFTVSANLIGAPAISIPMHRQGELPYGLQLMSAPRKDAELLSFSAITEDKLTQMR